MPLFDYVCPICKVREEVFVTDFEDVVFCIDCEEEMAKQPSAPGVFTFSNKKWMARLPGGEWSAYEEDDPWDTDD